MAWIWALFSFVAAVLHFLQKLVIRKNKTKNKDAEHETRSRLPLPGPKALPIIGHLHLLGKNPHRILRDLASKHGPIMGLRFGFVPTVVVSSPAAAELFLKTHDLVFASRPRQGAAQHLSYGQRNMVFGQYSPYWRHMRKLCTVELLSAKRIHQFRASRKEEMDLLVGSLRGAAERREVVDLSTCISNLNTDMVSVMVFGRKIGGKELDGKSFREVIMETTACGGKFNLGDYFPYIGRLDLQGINKKLKRLSGVYDRFLEKMIDDHLLQNHENRNCKNREDFVDTMVGLLESGELAASGSFEFDRRHVKAVLLDMVLAGMDTSAAAVEWALAELIRAPPVMEKLRKELECAAAGRAVEESDVERLEFLDMVVKETLRLHPVVPLMVPHESREDCVVDGFYIPGKSRVIVNAWAIGRDPGAWGHDPEAFRPERFAGGSEQVELGGGRHFHYVPFGAGRRSCPGIQLGVTVVKFAVAQLVHCFDWELAAADDLDMSEHFGLVTARAQHLMAIPRYRLLN
ncbi:cytochrome P450 71AU50-like [Andrographis paniculata]|uniref:cytochrome P450 71AU50-like n=1 Tax=Andrographis paniculata TaxID=175694 RepID=UPI0021E7F091|nr:cytochrome P450 71AU50-like [Andrographis paniculata]